MKKLSRLELAIFLVPLALIATLFIAIATLSSTSSDPRTAAIQKIERTTWVEDNSRMVANYESYSDSLVAYDHSGSVLVEFEGDEAVAFRSILEKVDDWNYNALYGNEPIFDAEDVFEHKEFTCNLVGEFSDEQGSDLLTLMSYRLVPETGYDSFRTYEMAGATIDVLCPEVYDGDIAYEVKGWS